ncbi:MAG: hypothetical protein FWF02_08700 [Micrococcales bacterium]|nr:hypothetical protein [Micrococcales bacterium]MCL2667767.1 hypothetical protein [Micrococcales bacterium]
MSVVAKRNPWVVAVVGMVVVGGLLGGCAQKPGVAATLTEVSCERGAGPPVYQVAENGTTTWGCAVGSLVRGDSWTISTKDVADLRTAWSPGLGYQLMGVPMPQVEGSDAVALLLSTKIVVRVADEQGMAASDDEAAAWLRDQQLDNNHAMRLVAKHALLNDRARTMTPQQFAGLEEKIESALNATEIVVNPRYGTFDPRYGVLVPQWAPESV